MGFDRLYKSRLGRMTDEELAALWAERLEEDAPAERAAIVQGLLDHAARLNAAGAAASASASTADQAGPAAGRRKARPGRGVPAAPASRSARTRVVIHNQEGPGGVDDVFVSVNGKAWLIKREHEALLPREVVEALENAEQTIFERDPDGAMRERRLKRFAFSRLAEPSPYDQGGLAA